MFIRFLILLCVITGEGALKANVNVSIRYSPSGSEQVYSLKKELENSAVVKKIESEELVDAKISVFDSTFPGTRKSIKAIFSPLPVRVLAFIIGNSLAFSGNPIGFAAALTLNTGLSFAFMHSDYRIADMLKKILPSKFKSDSYLISSVVFWTIAPSIYLAPLYPIAKFGLVNLSAFVFNALMCSVGQMINYLYGVPGYHKKANDYFASLFTFVNLITPSYLAVTVALLKEMKSDAKIAPIAFFGMLSFQALLLMVSQIFQKTKLPKMLPQEKIESARELRIFLENNLRRIPFGVKYNEHIEVFFNYGENG